MLAFVGLEFSLLAPPSRSERGYDLEKHAPCVSLTRRVPPLLRQPARIAIWRGKRDHPTTKRVPATHPQPTSELLLRTTTIAHVSVGGVLGEMRALSPSSMGMMMPAPSGAGTIVTTGSTVAAAADSTYFGSGEGQTHQQQQQQPQSSGMAIWPSEPPQSTSLPFRRLLLEAARHYPPRRPTASRDLIQRVELWQQQLYSLHRTSCPQYGIDSAPTTARTT